MPADPLARVKQAARAKRKADAEYRASALEAIADGVLYVELAEALGVSRQSARVMVAREQARNDRRTS